MTKRSDAPKRAPEVSRRLVELYDYMQRRLLAAQFEQSEAPLVEVRNLMQSLGEAWNQIPSPEPSTPAPAPTAIVRDWNTSEPPAAQSWSF